MIRLMRLWAGRWRSVLSFGLLIGVLLAASLTAMLVSDRAMRLHAAQRQSLLLVRGIERLLTGQLHHLERALRGVGDDAGAGAAAGAGATAAPLPTALPVRLRALSALYPELASVVLVDAHGRALSSGRGEPTLPRWRQANPGERSASLRIGSLQWLDDGEPALPLALQLGPERWLLARLRIAELQRILVEMAPGTDGLLTVLAGDGRVLARSAGAERIGQRLPLAQITAAGQAMALGSQRSGADRRVRIGAAITMRDYPLQIYAGIDQQHALRSWWLFLIGACLMQLLYLLGLAYLLRHLRRGECRRQRLLAELRAGDAELRLAHQAAGTGTWSIAAQGTHLNCSPLTGEMLGLPGTRMPLSAMIRRLDRAERGRVRRAVALAWQQGRGLAMTLRLRGDGGRQRWLAVRGAMVEQSGNGRRLTGTVVDISERIEHQTLALDAQRQFRMIFELNPLPCWLFEVETLAFVEVNPAAIEQYGYSREEFLSLRITDIRPPECVEQMLQRLRQLDDAAAVSSLFTVHRRRDGTLLDVHVHWSQLSIAGNRVALVLAENVTDHMAHQRELAFRANHDADTGLLTVRALAERLREAAGAGYSIVHVQVRGLQLIADTLGRSVGEEVLRRLCARLGRLADGCSGVLAFQPSQDFVLMIGQEHDPRAVIQALEVLLSEPVRGRDSLHPLEVRIGVAQYPRDAASAEETLAKAALAAREARQADVVVKHFDEAIARRLSERLHLIGRLHEAVHQGQFELHYQPVVSADASSPVMLEALLRWRRPGGELVPPTEFVPLCEDTGLILPLGRWALEQAARDRRRLLDAGWVRLVIAVNVSALQFLSTDVAADVAQVCREQGLERGMLSVELTETALLRNPEQTRQTMHRLHRQGVGIALDDFGTGFCNMSYLQDMPLDALKIDRSFVADVDSDERNAAICRALISLGHSLGLKVVAEGVERPGQRAWLADNGCEYVQGYLIARPAPLPEVFDWLRARA